MDSDSDSNQDSRFLWFRSHLYYFPFYYHVMYEVVVTSLWPTGCESRFVFEAVGFGFKKKGVDSGSAGFVFEVPGFGSGFGFEMPGFTHHCHEVT